MDDQRHSWLNDTVSGLAYSFAREYEAADRPEFHPPYNDLTRFVLHQHAQLPDYLRAPMRFATLGFDLLGYLQTGQAFHASSPTARARQIAAWKKSRLGFQRDFIRYYESLSTFALYNRTPFPSKDSMHRAPRNELRQDFSSPVPAEMQCEIAVIGSGPGGAITACLLAEAGRDVLLVEEGPFYSQESCLPFSLEEMRQKYRNGGQTVALGQNKISYVEGRCVGGGSEINSGLYHRTPPEILERWRREFEVQALRESDLLPCFEANEKELFVSLLSAPPPPASVKLRQGAARLNWQSVEVPRWFSADASGGRAPGRQTMTLTFIPRFLKAGGRLQPSMTVRSISRESEKWILKCIHDCSRGVRISAQTIFVCGGAVQTPALLRRSGITENIGNSLQLHPTMKVVARFKDVVNSMNMGVPTQQVKEFAPRLSFGCSISSPPFLALGLLEEPQLARVLPESWQQMATYYVMIAGGGSGTVRTIPAFRNAFVRYRLTETDRRDLANGLRRLCQLLFECGAVALSPSMAEPPLLRSQDDFVKLPGSLPNGRAQLMTIHLFSSCPMGENKSKCAVDSFGQVHAFKNLFVADASLLCSAPGVNPQGTIMGLARRNAMHFLEQRR